MPTGLLLVATTLHDRLTDRLAIANARRAPFDSDSEAVRESLGRDTQVHFALPPHDHLVRFRIVDNRQRGVFINQLVQGLSELDVILAFLGSNCDGEHRRTRLGSAYGSVRFLAG